MRLYLECSGGFANPTIGGEPETVKLPAKLARKAESLLTPERIGASLSRTTAPMPDRQTYTLKLFLDDGFREFTISETDPSPELIELLDQLIHELIKRKARALN